MVQIITGQTAYVSRRVRQFLAQGFTVEKTHTHPDSTVTVRLRLTLSPEDSIINA
jgi:hypothetical protein